MADWNTLTAQDVLNRFNPAEQASFAALGGQDNLASVVGDVVLTIRGAIKAGGGQRGPDGTIPNSLKVSAVSLAIWLWITSFSKNDKLTTDGRKGNYQDALKEIAEVRSGKQKVELPDAGETDSVSAPVNSIQVVGREPRQLKRCKTGGL